MACVAPPPGIAIEGVAPDASDENGILAREVLVEGSGATPLLTHEAKMHYECFLPDGTLIDSSRKREYPFTFALDQDQVIAGISYAVLTMRMGEKTRFSFDSSAVYGAVGCGDISPDIPLTVEIELLAFSERERNLHEMTVDELMVAASNMKTEGNQFVSKQEWAKASAAYKKGLDALNEERMKAFDEDDTHAPEGFSAAKNAIALNYAFVLIQLEQYSVALLQTEYVLKKDSENVKGLYRKSLALMGLGFLDEAKEILLALAKKDPSNREIRETFEDCRRKLDASNKRDKERYGALFSSK